MSAPGAGPPDSSESGAVRPGRSLIVPVVVVATLAVGVSAALAASYKVVDIINPEGVQQGERWGERTTNAELTDDDRSGDINEDDISDVVVGAPKHDTSSHTDAGRVYALRGDELASGSPTKLWASSPSQAAEDGANFGSFLAVPGDVTGGDEEDVAVGAPGINDDTGKAWMLDGADGSVAFELTNPNPQAGATFGERLGRAGDVNGDDVPDVIVGAPDADDDGNSSQGQAYVLSGADGSELYTLKMPDAESGAKFGLAVQSPGDVGSLDGNGDPQAVQDGVPDLFVNAGLYDANGSNRGRSYLFTTEQESAGAGATLDGDDVLTRIDNPEPQDGTFFGFQDAEPLSPGDVGGDSGSPDGIPDLYGNGFHQDVTSDGDSCSDPSTSTCNENQGKAWVFDGAASIAETDDPSAYTNGVTLYQLNDPNNPQPGGTFGWSMSKTFYNDDTIPDLYIGQAPHAHDDQEPSGGDGGSYVFDGEDDATADDEDATALKNLELPTKCESGNRPPALGWSSSALDDVDDDGQVDYIAGAPFVDIPDSTGTEDAGVEIFFSSANNEKKIDDCDA